MTASEQLAHQMSTPRHDRPIKAHPDLKKRNSKQQINPTNAFQTPIVTNAFNSESILRHSASQPDLPWLSKSTSFGRVNKLLMVNF